MGKGSWWNKAVAVLRARRIINRLVIIFLLGCLLPIVVIGQIFRVQYTNSINRIFSDQSVEILNFVGNTQVDLLDRVEIIARQIAMSDSAQSLLSGEGLSDYEQNQQQRELTTYAVEASLISTMVKNILIYDENRKNIFQLGYDIPDEQRIQELLEKTVDNMPLEYVTGLPEKANGERTIAFCRIIKSTREYNTFLGYVVVCINEEEFAAAAYKHVYEPNQGSILLLGDDGTVVSAQDALFTTGQALQYPELEQAIREHHAQGEYSFPLTLDSEKLVVSFQYESKPKWYTISLVLESYITEDIARGNRQILLFSILAALAGLFVLVLISTSIVQPVKQLVQYCRDVKTNRNTPPPVDTAGDELAFLTTEVGQMMEQINRHIENEQHSAKEKRNLELQMLQAQINPHFLFNTLNTLKWIAVMSKVPTLSNGIAALSGLLSNTILNKDEYIPIEQEIENLKDYVVIQSLRYGEKFKVAYNIEAGVGKLLIPKFLLQPVIENSILHGTDGSSHMVHITVGAAACPDGVAICIRDDGVGFTGGPGDAPAMPPGTKKLSRIGLPNVQERIRLAWGEPYGMQIESTPGQGTVVQIHIPAMEGDKDVQDTDR